MEYNLKLELKKAVRTKSFWAKVVIAISSVIMLTVLTVFGFLFFLIYTYTDYSLVAETDPLTKYPEEWTIGKGKIINLVRPDYVFPDDPLEYQVEVYNPKDEMRELKIFLKIFKGGELVDDKVIERSWNISGKKKITTDLPIFLKEEGTYNLTIRLVFDMQIPGSEHPNWTFHVDNIQVQSLNNKLLAESNQNNLIGYAIIGSVAFGGNISSIIYLRRQHYQTKEQLQLTRLELESRLRADLTVQMSSSNVKKEGEKYVGSIMLTLKNNGMLPARNIRVSFKDPTSSLDIGQLVRDEKEIKSTHYPVDGITIPESTSGQIPHNTTFDGSGPYKLAIWVQYDYADVKNEEFIQIVLINGQTSSLMTLFDKTEIEIEKKNQKELGLR